MGQKVAIYCRVSTTDQSCERQERDLNAFAQRAGYEVTGIFKEAASGIKDNREMRRKVLNLAQAREISAILVTELSRWSRSTIDLVGTLQSLQAWGVSIIALNGLQFDLATAHGKMIASVMASLAEFERDLIQERIKSGIATAKAKGKRIGRQKGEYLKSARLTPKVIEHINEGASYRQIAKLLSISKNTVTDIVKRHREANKEMKSHAQTDVKTIKVKLWMVVENNNKFVRGKKRSIESIESYVLGNYNMKKLSDYEYELTISYEDEEDLEKTIYEILSEAESTADLRHCFLQDACVSTLDGERHW